MTHTFRGHWRVLATVATLCVGCIPATHASPLADGRGAAPCADASHAGWQAVQQDLRAHGLVLRPACGASGAQAPQVVVLDSLRASEVLRGPLADGEALDLGRAMAQGAQGADESPDVAFNRDWVQAVLVRHQVHAQARSRMQAAPFQAVRFATR